MRKLISVLILTTFVAGCKSSTAPNGSGTQFAARQGVTGYVFDGATGQGIAGASIVLKTTPERRTTTNGGAVYLFDSVPTGTYNIQAWATGYDLQGTLVTVDTGVYKSLDFHIDNTSVANGLLALFRFSGNVLDSSPLSRPAVLNGGTYVADRFGNAASALQLNGTSNFVSIADASDLNFGKSNDFSICFWAKNPDFTRVCAAVHKGGGSPFVGYEVASSNYGLGADVGTTYGTAYAQMSPNYSDSRWHFFVFTFERTGGSNGTGTITLYFDGSLYGMDANQWTYSSPATAMQGNIDNTMPLLIGSDGSGHFFKGTIDDVRIYNGLLNAVQINTLYHEYGW